MPDYRRNRVPGGTYFFTVNLLNRRSTLLTDNIRTLRTAVASVKIQHNFHIDAWVVLPDHMHAVWTLPENDADYSGRWRAIKKAFAKVIPATEPRFKTRVRRGERGVWQQRSPYRALARCGTRRMQNQIIRIVCSSTYEAWVHCVLALHYTLLRRPTT